MTPLLMTPLLLALVLQLAPQAGAPQRQQQPRRAILEGVAVQAGEELVTLGEFERVFKRRRELEAPEGAAQEAVLQKKTLFDLWTSHLEAQKGADLGLDPAQVARISRANLAAEREKAGLQTYLAQLREEGKDAMTEETDRQHELLGAMWQYSVQGNAFAGRRATRDGTIRPGELRTIFEENKGNLAPTTVQIRCLIVTSAADGAEAARTSCADARERVLAGEDMALLVEERGAELRDSRGLVPFRPAESFRDPAVASFAQTAEIGDLSEVLPLLDPKTGQPDPELGYQLVQLHDRRIPPEPVFDAPEVQRILRQYFLRQRRELILERERERLRRQAYSWVNPLLAGSLPPAP